MTAASALRLTSVRNPIARGLVAFLAGVLVAAALFALGEALLFGLARTGVLSIQSIGGGLLLVWAPVPLVMPILMVSTVLIFGRLSPRQSSNNRWRGP